MSVIQSFFQVYPAATIAAYVFLVLLSWYSLLSFGYALNGGQVGRGRWWVFECFWESTLMNIPGGGQRKADTIRRMVGTCGDGYFISRERIWTHEDLRRTGEYETCGQAMFGRPFHFWAIQLITLLVAAAFGPAVICAAVLFLVFLGPLFVGWDWFKKKVGLES